MRKTSKTCIICEKSTIFRPLLSKVKKIKEKLKADRLHIRDYSTHRQTPWTDNHSSLPCIPEISGGKKKIKWWSHFLIWSGLISHYRRDQRTKRSIVPCLPCDNNGHLNTPSQSWKEKEVWSLLLHFLAIRALEHHFQKLERERSMVPSLLVHSSNVLDVGS